MQQLQTAVLSVCAISIVISILQMLKPNEKFQRQLRFFTAALLLLSILTPISHGIREGIPAWQLSTTEATQQQAAFAETVRAEKCKQVELQLRQTLAAELQFRGIPVESLEVQVHISETDSINITSVTVRSSTPTAAKQLLAAYLGEGVEILVEESKASVTE